VQQSIAAGVDPVCFSGDKMLGGPQAGIVVGRQLLVHQLQRHPLMRARRLADRLQTPPCQATLMGGSSAVGGGSAPGIELPTTLVSLQHALMSADALERRLRQLNPPIVARIEHDRVVLDLRTVLDEQDGALADGLVTL
jgi:L-seryl-tRNA(Ser) seleniumtransferase